MEKKITLNDVKQALLDGRFRENLPQELTADIQKFLSNPGCSCNHPIYKKVMATAAEQLAAYYPTKKKPDLTEQIEEPRNEWTVINCHIDELAQKLRKLPYGRKQLEIARWQDQVTVVVNDLDL